MDNYTDDYILIKNQPAPVACKCGGISLQINRNWYGKHWVQCLNCGNLGLQTDTRHAAVLVWNHRLYQS